MAGELSLSARLIFDKGGASARMSEGISVDVTGDAFTHEVQEIGTSEEILAQGTDLGTLGYLMLKNLDSTNYVQVGITGQYSIRLRAGEIALFRADADIYAKANNAAVKLDKMLIED